MPRQFGPAALAVALAVSELIAGRTDDTTLRDIVRDAGVSPRPAIPRALLDVHVSNGSDTTTQQDYIYAGWSTTDGRLDELHVLAVDRTSGAWKHHAYRTDSGPGAAPAGSILEVRSSPTFVTLDLHQNPSAGTTWVLRHDLSRAGEFYGWIKEILPNELMVYERSDVHFAPTHAAGISIYDPFAARSTSIYPLDRESAVRRAFVAGVKARWEALGEDWFRTHNHHGDPERFDSSSGRFAVAWPARSLAFEVSYDDFTGTTNGKSAATERIIVSCDGLGRASTVRCGESSESAWTEALPGRDADTRLREAAAHPRLLPWR